MSILRSTAVGLVAMFSILAGAVLAADAPEGDLFGRLKFKVKPEQPFQLLVRIRLKPGTAEKFAAEAAKAAKATAAEPGCEAYTFYEDLEHPGTVILFEKWKNTEALKSHIEQPYTVALLKLLADIEAEPSIQLLGPLGGQKPAR
ncbi:MAG TPA: antibiotic biosynthesis monooxygenase [Pirellulales bacterium]|jgi:quinol monooxygenase YgiN|nr:antibiotic biosynthesis monooxygenase [Pirellulales bacterium]